YRIKMTPFDAPASGLPAAIGVLTIRGDPSPAMSLDATAGTQVEVGSTFQVTTTVSSPSFVASGVHLERTSFPAGLTFQQVATTREDGISMSFGTATGFTLGNV